MWLESHLEAEYTNWKHGYLNIPTMFQNTKAVSVWMDAVLTINRERRQYIRKESLVQCGILLHSVS